MVTIKGRNVTPCFVLRSDQFSSMGSIAAVCDHETNDLNVTSLKQPPEALAAFLPILSYNRNHSE